MRVIVTGSRSTTPEQRLFVWTTLARVLGPILQNDDDVTLVEGECPYGGVDRDARDWGEKTTGVEVERHPADWNLHGRAAGMIRNSEMVAAGADLCIAFPARGSRGTWDCLKKAAEAGIPGRVYPLP